MAALTVTTVLGARWSCPVTAVSRPAWQLLAAHPDVRVHSVFSTAVNLRAGDRIVTCTSGGDRAPHGVDVPATGLERLRHEADTEGAVLRWRADGGGPLVYDPSAPKVSAEAAQAGAHRLLEHLSQDPPTTGFGDGWPELARDPALTAMIRSATRGVIDDAVLSRLGKGPGLTPSSDDVLAGALCALWSIGAADATRLAPLDSLLDKRGHELTTDVSVEYLHHACRGMATGAVRALMSALGGGDSAAVTVAVDRLRRFGHTSGMDMLLGVIIALTNPSD